MASRPHRRAGAMRRHRRRITGALWLFVSLAVVLPLTVRGGRQRVPDHAGSWMPATRVGSSACGLFSCGRWVERADGPASCPHPQRVQRLRVCRTPCGGSVLHAHKLLHQFLAARPCPARALRSASSVASAFVSVSSAAALSTLASVCKQRSAVLPEQPPPRRRRDVSMEFFPRSCMFSFPLDCA